MKKFVHLRGTHGVGKTTTARSLIERYGGEVVLFEIFGKEYPCTVLRQRNWAVTGRYDTRVCGGLDGVIKSKALMIQYIQTLLKHQYDVVVFEAVMYGMTEKFGLELNAFCRAKGYEYKGLLLMPPLETVIQNVRARNGGKPFNEQTLCDKYWQAGRAAQKLISDGVKVDVIDPSPYDKADLYKIIERAL